MRFTYLLLISLLMITAEAQSQEAADLYQKGLQFIYKADYSNAILVLKQAAEKDPKDVNILNDLGLAYFMAGQYKQGYDLLRPVAESSLADDRTFQITAMLLRGGRNIKEADQVYKVGLKEFPKSGPLLADYGEFLQSIDPSTPAALNVWERGISGDPAYPANYFFAAKAYAAKDQNIWAIVYGEIFCNMESYTTRTVEMKEILYECYKRAFAFELGNSKSKNPFEKEVAAVLEKQKSLTVSGITPELVTAIRTRFILDWYNGGSAERFPLQLFDHQQYLLQQGMYDAYNQWLFGSITNMAVFQNWTQMHAEEYAAFNQMQRNKLFKMPAGQYYQQ
jgi:tetratricopeptide (TPR) repeat protein